MTTRAQIKALVTRGDSFPAPTKPLHAAGLAPRPLTIFFTSGAVYYLPAESEGDRRFMVIDAPKPKRRTPSGCPIQVDGPYRARRKLHPLRATASALLLLLVAAVMRGG